MTLSPVELASELQEFIDRDVRRRGSTATIRPGHYEPWHWPPHPVAYDFHIPTGAWTEKDSIDSHGHHWLIEIAETESGIFGRIPDLSCDAHAKSLDELKRALKKRCAPLLNRWSRVARALEREGLANGSIRLFSPLQKLKLLYAEDRAVCRDAQREIEADGPAKLFGPSFLVILSDETHPMRRQAQWSVLDMLEDIPSFFPESSDRNVAIDAVVDLMRRAPDDYARTVFKAGVVLGGHVCTDYAADRVLELLTAESRIARRSAIHCVFHLAEWLPIRKSEILQALQRSSEKDPEPSLRAYAKCMARDIEAESVDHVTEPTFDDED